METLSRERIKMVTGGIHAGIDEKDEQDHMGLLNKIFQLQDQLTMEFDLATVKQLTEQLNRFTDNQKRKESPRIE